MKVIVLVLLIIAALFAIVSGVWVAIALVRAISTHPPEPASPCPPDGQINCREHREKIE